MGKDISVLREVYVTFDIPVAIERSRSVNGAYILFFFRNQIPVHVARKFGSALLTCAMNKSNEITFKSYDRLFPCQDTMPNGGFDNLIALPLQKNSLEHGNSVFIDEDFNFHEDQWRFLANIRKLSEDGIITLTSKLCHGNEMGALKEADEEQIKRWANKHLKWSKTDFPKDVKLLTANMICIKKSGISYLGLNVLKR
jgi:hypothetical protein